MGCQEGHLSMPKEEGQTCQSQGIILSSQMWSPSAPPCLSVHGQGTCCSTRQGLSPPPNAPPPTHTASPGVKRNNGVGRTGQALTELQTLDKWVGRQQVTICRQVISFANGFSKGKEEMCMWGGERQSRGHEKGISLTLSGMWQV